MQQSQLHFPAVWPQVHSFASLCCLTWQIEGGPIGSTLIPGPLSCNLFFSAMPGNRMGKMLPKFCGQDKGSMCASSHRMGMGGVSPKGEWCPAARRKNACLLCAKCCRQYPDVWVCTVLARLLDYCIFRFMSFTHDISRECTIA